MNASHYLSLSKLCIALAAVIFVFDVLDSLFLFIAGSHTWDIASGRTVSLNFLKGFTLYVTPFEYGLFVGSMACAGVLLLLGIYFYARLKRMATRIDTEA